MPNLEDEILDETLSHLDLVVNKKSKESQLYSCVERSPIRRLQRDVSTHLVESSTRNNEWDPSESPAATPIINFNHSERQDARFGVQTLHE
jgi:hypothetical protein